MASPPPGGFGPPAGGPAGEGPGGGAGAVPTKLHDETSINNIDDWTFIFTKKD